MILKAWMLWFLLWVPLMATATWARAFIGFPAVMAVLVLMLAATLLYQRYRKRRSWQSILWGARSREA